MQILKDHWVALIGALLMTLLVSAPLIAFPFYAGERYAGINIHHYGSDEHGYITRAKEVLEGHQLGQPVLAIGKDLPDPTFSSIERVLMFPFTATGLGERVDVVTIYNVYDFLGVALLVLILYALAYALSRDKMLSIATALFVIGGYSIIYNKGLFYDDFNIYLRSVYPWAASIPLFLYLWCLHRARDEEYGARFAILAGAIFGFLFYDYFFAWTFALAFSGVFFLVLLALRRNRYALRVALASSIGMILAIPLLVGFVRYYTSDAGAQLSYFLLSARGHTFVFSLVGTATLLLFVVHWWYYRTDENRPFLLAAILAGWIALNQQIITGRFIQYGHYYWYFIVPLSIVIGTYLFTRLLPEKWIPYFSVLLVTLVLLNTTIGQYRSFLVTAGEKMRDQDYMPLIQKLRALPKASVLTAVNGEAYPELVTIYTDDDLYYHGMAEVYNVSVGYMKDALLLYLYLNTHARKDPIGFVRAELDARTVDEYTGMYEDVEGYYSGTDYYSYHRRLLAGATTIAPVRGKLLSELGARYKELFAAPNAARVLLVRSGVRYVVWDKRIAPEWDLTALSPLRVLATSTDLVLYELVEAPAR